MIKNIVLDVGGVIFDDSKQNIQKLLNKNCDNIYKIAYGSGFKKCLLGEISVQEHINSLKDEKDFNDISYILKKENLIKSYPLIKNNFEDIQSTRAFFSSFYEMTMEKNTTFLIRKAETEEEIMDVIMNSMNETEE